MGLRFWKGELKIKAQMNNFESNGPSKWKLGRYIEFYWLQLQHYQTPISAFKESLSLKTYHDFEPWLNTN